MASTQSATAVRRAVLLLVDDYQDCRDMYAAYLTLAGYHVMKAGSGWEALELARRVPPDLVLMDLSLPGMDGCEATRRLKDDPRTSRVPVIALTAMSESALGDLPPVGFEAVICKPCLPDDLAREVEEVLRASRLASITS